MELVKPSDYWQRFYELLNVSQTNYQAYARLEKEYYDKYGVNRYGSYDSFKICKKRWVDSLRKKKEERKHN